MPIAYLLFWLLSFGLCWLEAFGGVAVTGLRARLRDARAAAVLGCTVLSGMLLYRYFTGVLGPVSLSIRHLTGGCSYQTMQGWCACAALHALCAVAFGLLLRSFFGLQARPLYAGVHVVRNQWRRGRRDVKRLQFVPLGKRTGAVMLLAVSAAAVLLCFILWIAGSGERWLTLEEICKKQLGAEKNLSYVVVHNSGALTNAPRVLYLSDREDGWDRLALTGAQIGSGGRQRFEVDSDAFVSIRREGGTTLYLSDQDGNVLDTVLLPEMPDDMAYRRSGDGWELISIAGGASDRNAPDAPVFSAEGGFYDAPFDLTISAAQGETVYYTLDGSDPDASSALYRAPIRVYDRSAEANRSRAIQNVRADYLSHDPIGQEPVPKAFVVRAVAVDSDGNVGPVVTRSYFVGQDKFAAGLTLSLVCDPDALFGVDGIYVTGTDYDQWYASSRAGETDEPAPLPNFMMRGYDSERPAALELFADAQPTLNQPIGVRIQGNSSRWQALKRFAFYSRKTYSGSNVFLTPIFPERQTHCFLIRRGLNHQISHLLAEGLDVEVLHMIPASLFVNGEFWYSGYVQEKCDERTIAQKFGVERDDVEVIRIGTWYNLSPEEKQVYQELLDTVASLDLTQESDRKALDALMDVQSYITYACVNVFLGNCDSNEKLNTCVWRTQIDEHSQYGDGRWRWLLNDMDLDRNLAKDYNGYAVSAEINSFSDVTQDDAEAKPALLSGGVLWETLMRSDAFRAQFTRTFMDLLNTRFSIGNTERVLSELGQDMDYDDGFFRTRAAYITEYLRQELGLTGTQETLALASDPEAGTIRLNTITPDLTEGSWSGLYFTDFPVQLTAEAAAGRVFDHWEVDGKTYTDPSIEITVREGGTSAHAFFK